MIDPRDPVGRRALEHLGGSETGVTPQLVATWDQPFGPALPAVTTTADIALAGNLLPIGRDLQMNSDQWQQARDFVTQRQIGRRALVGSTELNLGIIEDSYRQVAPKTLLKVLDEPAG